VSAHNGAHIKKIFGADRSAKYPIRLSGVSFNRIMQELPAGRRTDQCERAAAEVIGRVAASAMAPVRSFATQP
jgi:hypothetical protein